LAVEGSFEADDAVEIVSADKVMFAKGIARLGATRAEEWVGLHTGDLADDLPHEVVHRDDLVVL
jgi:glutamate 5-kinase